MIIKRKDLIAMLQNKDPEGKVLVLLADENDVRECIDTMLEDNPTDCWSPAEIGAIKTIDTDEVLELFDQTEYIEQINESATPFWNTIIRIVRGTVPAPEENTETNKGE